MSYSLSLTKEQTELLTVHYLPYEVEPTNEYTIFRAKYKESVLTIFKTNKILIQGKTAKKLYLSICELLNIVPEIDDANKITNTNFAIDLSLIGTDEVGTGDFFGGIVVAAAYVDRNNLPLFSKMGIRDSKEISDLKIMELGPKLLSLVPHSVHILDNLKFNYLNQFKGYNMNKIKAILHNSVILNLKSKINSYDGIIIDGFSTKEKYFEYLLNEKTVEHDVQLIEKAENKYISVAIASIIARYSFIKHFERLSDFVGFSLPKGAGPKVDMAIQKILKSHPLKYFNQIAKVNFKNLDKYKA